MDNRYVIISASYNVEKWIGKNILSVKKQNYTNFKHIIVDDMSSDRTCEIAAKVIGDDDRFVLIRNKEKRCSLANIYNAIHNHTTEQDIIVILDGDDFLASPNVLEKLNRYYDDNECWLTYGSYLNLSGGTGKFSRELPSWIVDKNLFREYTWCTSHLRTFKSFLFKQIELKDLKDTAGEFYNFAGDLAIMFPMLEMAGQKINFVPETLYIWNDLNDLNEHKVNNTRQMMIEREIRSKEKYNVIER